MQTFDQFIQDWTGKQPLYPPNPEKFRGQCYQLFNFYNRDVVGAPDYLAPLAHQIYTNFEKSPLAPFYDKIEYTSGATPQKGDVVVWSKNLPGSDGAGHVAPCTKPGVITFESFDSNWGGKQAHLVEHDFSYVLGWLRPKGAKMTRDQLYWHYYTICGVAPTEQELDSYMNSGKNYAMITEEIKRYVMDNHVDYATTKGKLGQVTKALNSSEKEVTRLKDLAGENGSAAQLKAALLAFLGLSK